MQGNVCVVCCSDAKMIKCKFIWYPFVPLLGKNEIIVIIRICTLAFGVRLETSTLTGHNQKKFIAVDETMRLERNGSDDYKPGRRQET